MTRALTLIAHNRIEAKSTAKKTHPAKPTEDIFQAFHADLEARAKIVTFPDGLKRRGR